MENKREFTGACNDNKADVYRRRYTLLSMLLLKIGVLKWKILDRDKKIFNLGYFVR